MPPLCASGSDSVSGSGVGVGSGSGVTVGVRFSPLASASAIRSSTVTVFRKYTFSPFFWRSITR